MDPSDIQELLTTLDNGREAFLDVVADVPESLAQRSPGPGRWSILQCVEHVALAEEFLLSQLKNATSTNVFARNKARENGIRKRGADRASRVEAPAAGQPTGRFPSIAEGTRYFLQCRERTIHVVQTSKDLHSISTEHPIVGQVNGYEMVLMMAMHPLRHAKQIHEIKIALGSIV